MIKKISDEALKASRPTVEEYKQTEKFPVSVVLENIRSLYNVGSMFRTSDGASIEKLVLSGYTGYPPRKELDKTSLGSVESVDWERYENPVEAVDRYKSMGYQIVALEHTTESIPYNEAEYKFPVCLLLGNEVEGVTDELVSMSDMAVDIPMYGIKQSLNVSVAYGIVIYHIVEQFRKLKLNI